MFPNVTPPPSGTTIIRVKINQTSITKSIIESPFSLYRNSIEPEIGPSQLTLFLGGGEYGGGVLVTVRYPNAL